MNRKQRMKNCDTARTLAHSQVCPECGERGLHWVALPTTLQDLLDGEQSFGFWTCPNLYGADGRRLKSSRTDEPQKVTV